MMEGMIMNTKTMEGIVGAKTNMDLLNTPFRVFKEARRRGDTAVMERAMKYVTEFSDKAEEYKGKADKGMKEDAKEAREKEKLEREAAIQRSRNEREKFEEKIEENRGENKEVDTVKISEEGKQLLEEDTVEIDNSHYVFSENSISVEARANKGAAIYTKTGEVSQSKQPVSISISI